MKKPDVKNAIPNVVKAYILITITFTIAWSMSHYVVNLYGGVWPNVSGVRIFLDLFKEFWPIVFGTLGSHGLFELFRRRK